MRSLTFHPPVLDRTTWLALGLIALHAFAALLFVVDLRLPFAVLIAAAAVAVGLERPLWGVGLLLAGRLTSTGANAWVRIGKVNLDLFEPALMLALGALFVHGAIHRKRLWVDAPWRAPVLGLLGLQALGLLWSANPKEGLQEIIATCVLLATTLAILAFVRTWEDARKLLYVWIGASMFIAAASFLGLAASEEAAFEMAQGSRESGFGQHPNWFAMNLMYAVLPCFGLAVIAKRGWLKALLFACGLFVFFAQMQSGSRGGTGAIFIGAGIAALLDARLRRVALIAGPLVLAGVAAVIWFDVGDAANAFARIFVETSGVMGKSVRVSNWEACWAMLLETWGRGIGPGGYEDQLMHYDYWLYQSQYRYPHGIFWGMMAHYGVIGLLIYGWFLWVIARMARDLLRWTALPDVEDGADLRLIALCMIGTLIGYWAWSFVEFMYDDKPFWEYLGLFTALWAVVRARAGAT